MADDVLEEMFRLGGGIVLVRDVPHLATRLQRLRRAGQLASPLQGVYVVPELAADPRVLAVAAGRWAPGVTVCGTAAAALTYSPQASVDRIELAGQVHRCVPQPFTFLRRGVPAEFRMQHLGAWVTTPPMTAAWCAATDRGHAIDHALRTGATTLAEIRWAASALKSCVGNHTRSLVIDRSRSTPWSYAERLLHVGLDRAGITGWTANTPVVVDGERYVLDVVFRRHWLVIEVDGFATHGVRDAFEVDRSRQNALVAAGFRVLRFTYRMIVEDLEGVLAAIRRELARPGRVPVGWVGHPAD